ADSIGGDVHQEFHRQDEVRRSVAKGQSIGGGLDESGRQGPLLSAGLHKLSFAEIETGPSNPVAARQESSDPPVPAPDLGHRTNAKALEDSEEFVFLGLVSLTHF